MQLRWPHADLLAVLFDFLLAIGFEKGFYAAEMLLFGLFLFGFRVHCYSIIF